MTRAGPVAGRVPGPARTARVPDPDSRRAHRRTLRPAGRGPSGRVPGRPAARRRRTPGPARRPRPARAAARPPRAGVRTLRGSPRCCRARVSLRERRRSRRARPNVDRVHSPGPGLPAHRTRAHRRGAVAGRPRRVVLCAGMGAAACGAGTAGRGAGGAGPVRRDRLVDGCRNADGPARGVGAARRSDRGGPFPCGTREPAGAEPLRASARPERLRRRGVRRAGAVRRRLVPRHCASCRLRARRSRRRRCRAADRPCRGGRTALR